MSASFFNCKHINQITDEREGTLVCVDCGLVLSEHVFLYDNDYNSSHTKNESVLQNEISEILERLNLPQSYIENVEENFKSITTKKNINLNTILAASVYKTFNKEKNTLSIKDVSAASGISARKISSFNKSIHILKTENILEKYCKINNLDFKNYAVIKEDLKKYKILGHNPLTLVGSVIYMHCKKNKIKRSMKDIAQSLGISIVSIQRFIKNELSFRR